MNARQQDILDALEFGDYNAVELGIKLGAPAPSIRRAIQVLRKKGHNIVVGELNAYYRDDAVTPAAPSNIEVSGEGVDAYDTDIDSSDEDTYGGGW